MAGNAVHEGNGECARPEGATVSKKNASSYAAAVTAAESS